MNKIYKTIPQVLMEVSKTICIAGISFVLSVATYANSTTSGNWIPKNDSAEVTTEVVITSHNNFSFELSDNESGLENQGQNLESYRKRAAIQKLSQSLAINGETTMTSDEKKQAATVFDKFGELPVLETFSQFNDESGALFVTMKLPHDVEISATYYLRDDDDDVYFSFKGRNELIYSDALPLQLFVDRTIDVLDDISSMS